VSNKTVQVCFVRIIELLPSQFVSSVKKSSLDAFIVIKYFVIGDPFANGAYHVIITVFVEIVVTGAIGGSGTKAQRTVKL
jgi:hypothetical protein